jgi:hypothetical protein
LADAQEALDELDHLLGVLEPNEAIFCLDVVERSLREMLEQVLVEARPEDVRFWKALPDYQALPSLQSSQGYSGAVGEGSPELVDDAYLQAIQELRVE